MFFYGEGHTEHELAFYSSTGKTVSPRILEELGVPAGLVAASNGFLQPKSGKVGDYLIHWLPRWTVLAYWDSSLHKDRVPAALFIPLPRLSGMECIHYGRRFFSWAFARQTFTLTPVPSQLEDLDE